MSNITDLKAWRQRRQAAAQAAALDAPDMKYKVSIVKGRVHVHMEDAHVELDWSLAPEAARTFASMLLCNAEVAESQAGLPARRFRLQRRRAGYEVWLCQGAGRTNLPVPVLRRREEARAWAMVYAALHGWPYLEIPQVGGP